MGHRPAMTAGAFQNIGSTGPALAQDRRIGYHGGEAGVP